MEIIYNLRTYKTERRGIFSDITFIFLGLAILILPFHKTFGFFPYTLAFISCALMIVSGRQRKGLLKMQYVSAAIFLVFIYAFFISDDRRTAMGDLEGKIYILLAPIMFGSAKFFSKKVIYTFAALFVCACLLMSLTCIGIGLYAYIRFHENNFYYKELLAFTEMHPAYLGLYINFATVCIALYFINGYVQIKGRYRLGLLILIVWLSFFILLLSAKTAILVQVIFLNGAFLYWGYKYSHISRTIIVFLCINALGITALLSLHTTRERFRMLFMQHEGTSTTSVDSRRYIWQSVLGHADEFWLTGTGSGDAEEALVRYYKEDNFQKGVDERYNTHNQFLETWVMSGIGGLAAFILIFTWLIRYSLRRHAGLYFCFLTVFIINCLTESMLETQSGTIFFCIFNTLLISAASLDPPKAL